MENENNDYYEPTIKTSRNDKQFQKDVLNVTGNIVKTSLNCIEKQHNELEKLEKDKQQLITFLEDKIKNYKELEKNLKNDKLVEKAEISGCIGAYEEILDFVKIKVVKMSENLFKKYVDQYFEKYMCVSFEKFLENWEEKNQWIEQLRRENEKLKEALENKKVCYYNNKAYDIKTLLNKNNILTEFEKWLEEAKESIKFPVCNTEYIHARNLGYYLALKDCKDKLQELKEGKK